VDEYDLDHATLKRETRTIYFTGGNFAGTGVNNLNILTLPAEQDVYDAGDLVNPKSQTIYEYDNYTADANMNNMPLQTYSDYSSIPGRTHSPETVFDTTYTQRGNATRVTRMIDNSTSINSYTRYDVLGNVMSIKDLKTNVSAISYLDDFGDGSNPGLNTGGHSTYALPTRLTSPAPNAGESPHTAYTQYDFSTGLLTGFKDRNGTITQTFYNDAFDRPTQIKAALGTTLENHTAMYYAPTSVFDVNLTSNDVLTARNQVSIDDGNLRSWTHTDGFGRTIQAFSQDPQGNVQVATTYDGLGRAKRVTNPYRSTTEATYGYADTAYDLAGRVISVTTSDSAVVTTAYSGARVLVTDQAGKQRISKTDGLGRLTDVWEIRSTDAVTGTEPVTFPGHSEVQVTGYGGADSTKQKFTQKERDSESGLDYFGARYYSSAQGRFTSPDPLERLMLDQKKQALFFTNPQRWNKYVYVLKMALNPSLRPGTITKAHGLSCNRATTLSCTLSDFIHFRQGY
jgi:RHS repeat-associated protein